MAPPPPLPGAGVSYPEMVKATVFEPNSYVLVAAAVAVKEHVPFAPAMTVRGDEDPIRQEVFPALATAYVTAPGPEDIAADGENCLPPPDEAVRLGLVSGFHVLVMPLSVGQLRTRGTR